MTISPAAPVGHTLSTTEGRRDERARRYEPGVACKVAAVEPDPGGAASFDGELLGWETDTSDTGGRPYDVPGFRQAVLADPEGAAFTVSRLVTSSQGA